MPVIIGQLDVIAAPPSTGGEAPPDAPPRGISVRDIEDIVERAEARRRRREAD